MKTLRQLIGNPWIRRLAQAVLAIAILYFMIVYLQDQWEQIEDDPPTVNLAVLALAQLGIVVGMVGIQPIGTLLAIRGLDGRLNAAEVWQAFFIGQIAKYLPGSLWSLPSRGFLYNQRGLPAKNSFEVVLWETGLAVVAAAILFIGALPMLWGYTYLPLIVLEIGGFSVAFLGGSFLLRVPQIKQPFTRIKLLSRVLDAFPICRCLLSVR